MTNAEAIETLRANYPDACFGQLREAVGVAIEALKAQGAAGDTISRQAAIDEIEYELEMINSALDSITLDFNARERLRQRRGEAREILNSIQQLPPAEPEPSDVARAIATIIENEQDMRVILQNERKTGMWIPCSERLPEKYGWYMCTLKDYRVNTYYWNNKGEWIDNGKKHFFELYNISSRYTGKDITAEQEGSVYWTDWVIAWMPLPEPYREERKTDERTIIDKAESEG